MKVYCLRMEDLDMWLEPVFESRVAASRYKEKYKGRKIAIEEIDLAKSQEHVYRLSLNESDGYDLIKDLFSSLEDVYNYITNRQIEDYKVIQEKVIGTKDLSYNLEGVCI